MDLFEIERSSLEELYKKTLNNEFDTGNRRKEILGEIYPLVQNYINIKLGYPKRYDVSELLKKIAINILRKKINEEKIKQNLGKEYFSKVSIEMEKSIDQLESELKETIIKRLAEECIEGIHGDFIEREKNIEEIYEKEIEKDLPKDKKEKQKEEFYQEVRSKVNEILEKKCDEAANYYQLINSYAEKVHNLYDQRKFEEIENFKKEHIHDYPLILFVNKKSYPEIYSEIEEEDIYKQISIEAIRGHFKDGQDRVRFLDIFSKGLYEKIKEYIEKYCEEETKRKLKEEN